MAKYPYQKMKNAELRRLCAERGVDIDLESAKRLDLVKALRNHDDQVAEEMGEDAVASTGKDDSEKSKMKGKVKILVPNIGGERSSHRPLFVGCNGRSWYIPLEQPVIVPKEVKNVLELAVRRVTQSTDSGRYVERNARRVPYQILEEGPD